MPERTMPTNNNNPQVNQPHGQTFASNEESVTRDHQMNVESPGKTTSQPGTDRSPQDYARQQDDIRANQTYGESSLEKVSDRENQRNTGLQQDEIAPKNDKGYDISPTATNVKI
jgi:hypothetical protein